MGSQRILERWAERAIDLHHVQVAHAGRQVLGQHPQPPADLERHVAGFQLRQATDHPEDVVVDQEVLAELAIRAHAEATQTAQARLARLGRRDHHPKTRAAVRSTAASSSAYEMPRRSATCSAVATTLEGSLGLPRTGWGDR